MKTKETIIPTARLVDENGVVREYTENIFLLRPVPDDDPRYGKQVQPIPLYDENGIPNGIRYEYV